MHFKKCLKKYFLVFGCILENIIENIFSTCCSHFLTFSQLLNKYIISFLSPQHKRNKTKEKKSSNPVKLRCDRHGATCGSWVRGATISGLTILGFLGSRSLSLYLCVWVLSLSLSLFARLRKWFEGKILAENIFRVKGLNFTVNWNSFRKIHFPCATKHEERCKTISWNRFTPKQTHP